MININPNPEIKNVKRIGINNVEQVMSLIQDVINEMEKAEIYQWDNLYPDYETVSRDITAETIFGVFKNFELAGMVVLDQSQSPEYSNLKWELDSENSVVMHRLCVSPKFQRKGIAKTLLNFSEHFALNNGYKSIRLDAFSGNPIALHLYEDNGYKRRGMVTFRKGNFYCYEKSLVEA